MARQPAAQGRFSGVVSSDQFTQLSGALRDTGGFTMHLPTRTVPSEGISVAPIGHEQSVPGVAAPKQLRQYAMRKGLNVAPAGVHFGGWNSGDTSYLDKPTVHSNEITARSAMRSNNQQAGFDLGSFTEIANPHYNPNVSNQGRAWKAPSRAGGVRSAGLRRAPRA